jgi:hypothetical protein
VPWCRMSVRIVAVVRDVIRRRDASAWAGRPGGIMSIQSDPPPTVRTAGSLGRRPGILRPVGWVAAVARRMGPLGRRVVGTVMFGSGVVTILAFILGVGSGGGVGVVETHPPVPSSARVGPAPSSAAATPSAEPPTSPPVGPPSAEVPPPVGAFNEFDINVQPGFGYDLDIPPGGDPYANFGWQNSDASRPLRDLYRTGLKSPVDKVQGLPLPVGSESYNRIVLVGPADRPERCRAFGTSGDGSVPIAALSLGSKVCIRTHSDRWAMLRVTRVPSTNADLLGLHVTVLMD